MLDTRVSILLKFVKVECQCWLVNKYTRGIIVTRYTNYLYLTIEAHLLPNDNISRPVLVCSQVLFITFKVIYVYDTVCDLLVLFVNYMPHCVWDQ